MAPQIVAEACPTFEFSQTETDLKQLIPETEGNRTEVSRNVTINAYPVMPRIWPGDVCLKSCLKKPNNCLTKKSGQIWFSPQTEVRYYLSRPLVAESRLKRMISNIKGKLLAKN